MGLEWTSCYEESEDLELLKYKSYALLKLKKEFTFENIVNFQKNEE